MTQANVIVTGEEALTQLHRELPDIDPTVVYVTGIATLDRLSEAAMLPDTRG